MDTEPVASSHAAAQGHPGPLPAVTTSGRPKTTFYQRHDAMILGGGSMFIVLALWEWAWQAKMISPLFFSGPSAIWSFSPQITVPIFEMGATKGRLDVSKLQKSIEIANYEKAIQVAFREVADALAIRAILDEKLKAQEILLNALQKRFDLTTARYNQGVDTYLDVLLAEGVQERVL